MRFDESIAALRDLDVGLALGGATALLLPAFAALISFWVLRREVIGVRIAGAVLSFVFPFLAVVGWVVYPRVRGRFGDVALRLQEAARQAQAAAQQGAQQAAQRGEGNHAELLKRLRQAGESPGAGAQAAVAQVRAASKGAAHVATTSGTPGHAHAALDPARLLSSDLSVRFNTRLDGDRKLNIPKVVE